jgi:hypothetical protein
VDVTRRYIWLALALGVWEIAAPYVLSSRGVALVVEVSVGLAVLILSLWALARWPQLLPRWLTVVAGAVLVFAPFVTGYAHHRTALANDVVIGIAAVVVAGYGALSARSPRVPALPVEDRPPDPRRDEIEAPDAGAADADRPVAVEPHEAPGEPEKPRRDDEDATAA